MPLTSTYSPSRELDVRATLGPLQRGRLDPTMRWDDSGVWRTMRTPLGAATLHIRPGRDVALSAWGPGAEWALAAAPDLLGARDDAEGFDARGHALIAELHRRSPGLRLTRTSLVFDALVPAVLEQKVTILEALRAWRTLVARFGDDAPGPAPLGMRVAPSPDAWRRIPSWEWHRAGVGPQRSETIVRCARVAGSLDRHGPGAAGDSAGAIAALRSLPGIGVWTAAETVQRSHGDPDTVSVGDYHLHDTVGWALAGRRGDDAQMLELLEPWRGHRQRVVRLLLAAGIAAPRRGPRITIQDHRAH